MKIEKLKHSLRLMLLLTCLLCSLPSLGNENVTIDDITYSFTGNGGVEIESVKDCQGEIIIPYSIYYHGGNYTVRRIGENAFRSDYTFSVVINAPIGYIGKSAFHGCRGLTSIDIPNIRNGETTIDSYAFKDCSSLTSIKIPNSVTSIGNNAFNGCI